MLNEVRAKDYAKANETMQLFFDWIVIHGFEKCTPTILNNLDKEQRVLKYGIFIVFLKPPYVLALILRARLSRKFGYMYAHFLNEQIFLGAEPTAILWKLYKNRRPMMTRCAFA